MGPLPVHVKQEIFYDKLDGDITMSLKLREGTSHGYAKTGPRSLASRFRKTHRAFGVVDTMITSVRVAQQDRRLFA